MTKIRYVCMYICMQDISKLRVHIWRKNKEHRLGTIIKQDSKGQKSVGGAVRDL